MVKSKSKAVIPVKKQAKPQKIVNKVMTNQISTTVRTPVGLQVTHPKPILSDTKAKVPLPRLPTKIPEEPKKKKKSKSAPKERKGTKGNVLRKSWSKPMKMKGFKDFIRHHHVSFSYENGTFKELIRYDYVTGEEMDVGEYGQYYRYAPDKAGMIYKYHVYYVKVPSNRGKKYAYRRIKIDQAKKYKIYQEPEFLTPEVALKQINVYLYANQPKLRFITKYI